MVLDFSDGSAPILDVGVGVDSAAIDFDGSDTAQQATFAHLDTMDAATGIDSCYRVDCGHGTCSSKADHLHENSFEAIHCEV